jgi:hydrogenase maturation protein HypF
LAQQGRLTGWVLNDSSGVTLEVQGGARELETFERRLRESLPPLARIDSCVAEGVAAVEGESAFAIRKSEGAGGVTDAAVTVDTATCPECLGELFGAGDRREGHAFINCTNCGPRFSIVRDIPYDRCNTTMAGFEMCGRCSGEYWDAGDRRFHAQPVCCPKCGPKLRLVDSQGRRIRGNPIGVAGRMLAEGKIVAIKGIGGFHLAVRADREGVVARLRSLKRRDSKPFALMVANVGAARELVELSAEGEAALASCAAPIVLAPRRGAAIAAGVADGTHQLGVMLPYTPV